MNHLSLFNGIGGFQLAAHWMGWNNVAHVEIDPFCNKVVARHFPESKCYLDIKEFKGEKYNGTIDIISGGFPCQPFSHAGKRKGEEDDRFLWPEMLRIINEVKPSWIVGENVAGILSMENGRTFERICTDLENSGYEVQPYNIPAAGVGAWHRRERVWILAYSNGSGWNSQSLSGPKRIRGAYNPDIIESGEDAATYTHGNDDERKLECRGDTEETKGSKRENKQRKRVWVEPCTSGEDATYTNEQRSQGMERGTQEGRRSNKQTGFRNRTENQWQTEPDVGRVADGVPNRVDRLKALGNAIVPQVAYEIFKAIKNA